MAEQKKQTQPPSQDEPEKTPEEEKNLDRDGGERQPTQHTDQK